MKRYARIFFLISQYVLEYKSRAFIWFLVTLLNAGLYLLFWRGVISGGNEATWSFSSAVSYYLLLIIVGSFLHVHIEEDVAFDDIQRGWLAKYLMRPFSYFRMKFLEEFPWRLIQALFGVIIVIGIILVGIKFPIVTGLNRVVLAVCVVALGYMLTFVYKMIIGISAFWTTDFSGLHNLEAIAFLLFGGFIIPLNFLPAGIRSFALLQPIAYMIYYPVISLQGVFNEAALVRIIAIQCIWLCASWLVYQRLWRLGLRRFTGVGQ